MVLALVKISVSFKKIPAKITFALAFKTALLKCGF